MAGTTIKFRKLRIAWSVLCGVACVLLIGLWVRSYWVSEEVQGRFKSRVIACESQKGRLHVTTYNIDFPLELSAETTNEPRRYRSHETYSGLQQYMWSFGDIGSGIYANTPDWFLVAISATLAAVPWIRWSRRFSLRTLLIATTLVAIALGAIVWQAQQ